MEEPSTARGVLGIDSDVEPSCRIHGGQAMNGTATRRAPISAVGNPSPSSEFAPESWLDATDDRFERARSERRRVGLVRQACYVAIDVTLVCLGAIATYGIRFGFTHYLGVRITPI